MAENIFDSVVGNGAVSVGVAATLIKAATDRRAIIIRNNGGRAVFIGDSAVTTANGMPLNPNPTAGLAGDSITLEGSAAVYGIVGSGTIEVRYIELTD